MKIYSVCFHISLSKILINRFVSFDILGASFSLLYMFIYSTCIMSDSKRGENMERRRLFITLFVLLSIQATKQESLCKSKYVWNRGRLKSCRCLQIYRRSRRSSSIITYGRNFHANTIVIDKFFQLYLLVSFLSFYAYSTSFMKRNSMPSVPHHPQLFDQGSIKSIVKNVRAIWYVTPCAQFI